MNYVVENKYTEETKDFLQNVKHTIICMEKLKDLTTIVMIIVGVKKILHYINLIAKIGNIEK